MKAAELVKELEAFRTELEVHGRVWGKSLDDTLPTYPVRNTELLSTQCKNLGRRLGALKPYLRRFRSSWVMVNRAIGAEWDALDAAVSVGSVAQIKGPSIQNVIAGLDQMIGNVQALPIDEEIPRDPTQPLRSGASVESIVIAYLDQLHPFIARGCRKLFIDGHYAQAVEEAAKAVFQYIRQHTGRSADGAALVDAAYSLKNPILAFSDLKDETKRNEQIGFMEMLKGFAKGVRNPLAHTHGAQEEAQKAFEYLVMASLFCRRIDDSKPGRVV